MRQWITSLDKHTQTIAKKNSISVNSVTNLEKNKDLKKLCEQDFLLKKTNFQNFSKPKLKKNNPEVTLRKIYR